LLQFVSSFINGVTFFHNHHVNIQDKAQRGIEIIGSNGTDTMGNTTRTTSISPVLRYCIELNCIRAGFCIWKRETKGAIKDIVTASFFRDNLDKSLHILKPLDKWIKFFQSDKAEISDTSFLNR
jgi:hypothetical protein